MSYTDEMMDTPPCEVCGATDWQLDRVSGDPSSYYSWCRQCGEPEGTAAEVTNIEPSAWRVVDNTMERGRWVKLPDGRRQWRGPERDGAYVLPAPTTGAERG